MASQRDPKATTHIDREKRTICLTENIMQIRHVDLGIFQGCVDGETYWHPFTRTPTLGICPVSKKRAQKFILDLCEINPGYTPDQFIVEPLDKPLFNSTLSMAGSHEL
jgi:hypothetical protein